MRSLPKYFTVLTNGDPFQNTYPHPRDIYRNNTSSRDIQSAIQTHKQAQLIQKELEHMQHKQIKR